ncbi:uncharacterized protein LOC115058215 [Lates japonicus]|uniref:Uncharacterized protein n=1 Tax=Lates japonicus TaxID=270547 RepID=A0AAD3RLD6_LATJO|nr:uncharacterized protein AKAME5_002413700 [Lates japonicus]
MPDLKPELFVLSPLLPEGSPRSATDNDVCLATNFRPRSGQMILNLQNKAIPLSTSEAVLSMKQRSYFFAAFRKEIINSCVLHGILSQREEPRGPCENKDSDDKSPHQVRPSTSTKPQDKKDTPQPPPHVITTIRARPSPSTKPQQDKKDTAQPPPHVITTTRVHPSTSTKPQQDKKDTPQPPPHVITTTKVSPSISTKPQHAIHDEGGHDKKDTPRPPHRVTTKSPSTFTEPQYTVHDEGEQTAQDEHDEGGHTYVSNARPCLYDKAKLNFYIVVMNTVRLVFTKTLALNTILTIRAVLF